MNIQAAFSYAPPTPRMLQHPFFLPTTGKPQVE